MKALILAGGLGTRLRPLTYTRPKHLLPIANRPHLEHVFDLLQRHGIDEAVLLTSYLAEAFQPAIRHAEERGMKLRVTFEEEPLGTAGGLRNAASLVGPEPFFAFNGDVLTDADLGALLDFHRSREAEATIMLTPVEDPSAYGVVPTDDTGKVLGFIEKPPAGEAPTDLINAGVYVLQPTVLERIPEGKAYSAERELFPELVDAGTVYASRLDGYWMDIGTPQKYLQANLDALSGAFSTSAAATLAEGAVLTGPEASISEEAEVLRSCIGPRSRIGSGSIVKDSVLLADVEVQGGATVTRTILGEGVTVMAGGVVRDGAVADGETVEADCRNYL